MVKVICRGGPYFWVKEPFSDFEKRLQDADAAECVRERQAKGWITALGDFERDQLVRDPVPAFSAKERKQANKEYSPEYWLGENEVYPRTEQEEADHWAKQERSIKEHGLTFYGDAPHRPSSSARAADPQTSAAAERSNQQLHRKP